MVYIYIPIQYGVKFKHPASKFPQFGLTKWVFRFIKQILNMPIHFTNLDTKQSEMEASNKFLKSKDVSNAILASKETYHEISKLQRRFHQNLKATGHCSKAPASLIEDCNPWDLAYPASAHTTSNTYLIDTTCKYQREHSSCK